MLDLYTKVTVNNNVEFDWLTSNLENWIATINPTLYQVGQGDLGRLDIVSSNAYGSPYFWRPIAYVNNIISPNDDMFIGQQLVIPTLTDWYNFYNANAKTPAIAFESTNGFYSL